MPAVDSKTRIRNIQARLKVPATGLFDIPTAQAFEALAGYPMRAGANQLTHIVSIQMFLKITVDGVAGPEMLTRVENFLSTKLPPLPAGTSIRVSRQSMDMLIGFEVSSEAQYNKNYQKPIWPGGESGVTVGIGYDLGFNDRNTIAAAWSDFVSSPTLSTLQSVAGLTGVRAKNALAGTSGVSIDYTTAQSVFYQTTLPVYARRTKSIYPGMEKLPPDAQGALLSLVYNRGESLDGPSRAEMKNIAGLVAEQDLQGIGRQIRNMKRLWKNKNLPGLLARRDQEASLVEQASFNILSEDIIII
ncbi:MAG: hypothetical protein JNL13_00365 [Chitinophagaceae bacterium]|nr:hypothetical protein [Chitinophagaceae bacterium]